MILTLRKLSQSTRLFFCVSGLLLLAVQAGLAEETGETFSKKTFVYKTVGQLKIEADVYRHDDGVARPVVVWLHGGALIMGSRTAVPKQLQDLAKKQRFVLVSFDYRLAPQAKLGEIVQDTRDGIAWVRQQGPKLFAADPSRMVVAGASAGGYLALMAGVSTKQPPIAIVSYWGFGDVDGDWTTKPNDAYRKGKLIEKEVAWSGVGDQVLTSTDQTSGRGRSTFFVYLKQTGQWVSAVAGLDPVADREKLAPLSPIRNLTPDFPPTMLLHGTADPDVPVEQSTAMAAALQQLGVPCELITIENGGHGLWGGDRKLIEQAFQRSLDYITERLNEEPAGG